LKENKFIEQIERINLNCGNQEKAFYLLYVLMAWKHSSNEIKGKFSFENFYNSKIEVDRLLSIFEEIKSELLFIRIFLSADAVLLREQSSPLENNDLIKLCNLINTTKSLPNVSLGFKIIHQFFNKNDKNNELYISSSINKLTSELIDDNSKTIYIPFNNSLEFLYSLDKKREIYTESKTNHLLFELLNILDGIKITHKDSEPLIEPSYINKKAPHLLEQFDSCVLFLPFGRKNINNSINVESDKFDRFHYHNGVILDVNCVEHTLAQTEKQAILYMPVGFTYRGGSEAKLRKDLIENNYLESVIQLAPNLDSNTSTETTIIVINKKKNDDKVHFINLKDSSFLKKDGRKVILDNFDKIIDIYKNKIEIDNISRVVNNEEIKSNKFSFSVERYMKSKESLLIKEYLESYKTIELQTIATVRKSQLFSDENEGKTVYEISPSDFSSAGFTMKGTKSKKIKKQLRKLYIYKLEKYDVILSTKGTIGKIAIYDKVATQTDDFIVSQANVIIRINEDDSLKRKNRAIELYMFLKSNIGQNILKELVSGTVMPQISTDDVKKMKIPIIYEEEKEKISKNFYKEIKIFEKINKLQLEIENIHSEFLKV